MIAKALMHPKDARCWTCSGTISSSWRLDVLMSYESSGAFSRAFKGIRNTGCNSYNWSSNKP